MIRGLYAPRDSWMHRLRPGIKLIALPMVGTTLFLIHSFAFMMAAFVAVLLLYLAARLSPRIAWAQVRPALPVLVIIFLAQFWLDGGINAITVTVRLATLILLAALITLTTRTADLVSALERFLAPLQSLGIDAVKVSLAISLTIRFIPVVAGIGAEVREAQRARGLERSFLALAVPVIVRTLKMTDEIAEAIDARS